MKPTNIKEPLEGTIDEIVAILEQYGYCSADSERDYMLQHNKLPDIVDLAGFDLRDQLQKVSESCQDGEGQIFLMFRENTLDFVEKNVQRTECEVEALPVKVKN